MDLNAVENIHVKLRHGETNAKLPRTPYNLEQAIGHLFVEVLDLTGESSAYRVFGRLAREFALSKGWEAGAHPSDESSVTYAVAAAIEALVNAFPDTEGLNVAELIVHELRDMELID